MAQVKRRRNSSSRMRRASPLKPSIRGARNWASAQMRAASYTPRSFWRVALYWALGILTVLVLALWLGGFIPDAKQMGQEFSRKRLMAMGFVVERIDVLGEGRMREDDVRLVLGTQPGDFLFELDLDAAQTRIENLSWVEEAVIRRLWPNRIAVYLVERKPYALWQHDGNVQVVDIMGETISQAGKTVQMTDYPGLNLVVGPKAPEHIDEIDALMAAFPNIQKRVRAMVYTETQRWDLLLDNGNIRIKLPRNDPRAALIHVKEMQLRSQVLDRNISVIDLRLPDRITLRPQSPVPA